jgi:hypothetical protein
MTCAHPKPWVAESHTETLVDERGYKKPGRNEWVFACNVCGAETGRDTDLFVGTDFDCNAPPKDLTTVSDLDLFYLWFAAHTDHPLYVAVVKESQRRGRWKRSVARASS